MSSGEIFPTSFNMPSSITSNSVKMLAVSTTKVTPNNVILSTVIPNSTTGTITAKSSSTSHPNTMQIITTSGSRIMASSNDLAMQSSSKLVSISMELLSITKKFSAMSSSNTIVVSTSIAQSASQSSSALSPLPTRTLLNSDIVSLSSNRPTPTNSPLSPATSQDYKLLQSSTSKLTLSTSILSPSSSSTLMNTISEMLFSVKSTELFFASRSISPVPTDVIMTGDNVIFSNTIQPTVSVAIPTTGECKL